MNDSLACSGKTGAFSTVRTFLVGEWREPQRSRTACAPDRYRYRRICIRMCKSSCSHVAPNTNLGTGRPTEPRSAEQKGVCAEPTCPLIFLGLSPPTHPPPPPICVLQRGPVGPRGPPGPPGIAGVPGVDGIDVSFAVVRDPDSLAETPARWRAGDKPLATPSKPLSLSEPPNLLSLFSTSS